MPLFSFFKKKTNTPTEPKNYADLPDFVDANVSDIKRLFSAVGYNDRQVRLRDLASMVECQSMLLCKKTRNGTDKFAVVDSSDEKNFPPDTPFTWQHNQAAASATSVSLINSLPFNCHGAFGFISVPIKNSTNNVAGILLGLANKHIDNLDASTRLLHMMAPLFSEELEIEKLKEEQRQYEQRIISLNQTVEVTNADLKREREKSKENSEFKSIFLTNLSAEIRTPMNAVLGFVDLLSASDSEEDRAKFIEIIRQNANLMLSVIDNLLDISNLQSSYMFNPICPQQLNGMLDELKEKYETKLRKDAKAVIFNTSYALQTPNDTVWNSAEIIVKVMDQLLDNACKFTQKGEITMGYFVDTHEMTFFVRDTGRGIPKERAEAVFQMFATETKNDSEGKDYTMGLTMAQKYVALTGGRIWVDTAYTSGTNINFSIPNDKL